MLSIFLEDWQEQKYQNKGQQLKLECIKLFIIEVFFSFTHIILQSIESIQLHRRFRK